jgi:predicted transcriptional regulator
VTQENDRLQELVAQVAAAYFSNSHTPLAEIPQIITQIATSLGSVGASPSAAGGVADEPPPLKLTGAQIRKSITPDALISFEDNRPYKALRRHLATRGLSPDEYRSKWGLPPDYPMVSPNYSARRAELAKQIGLGQMGRGRSPDSAQAAARRGRPRKSGAPREG